MTYVVKIAVYYISMYITICETQEKGQDFHPPKIEALSPWGFRVTLDDAGYTNPIFGYNANINMPIQETDDDNIIINNMIRKHDKWVYTNDEERLDIGDTLHYWIFVTQNGKGRKISDLKFTVTKYGYKDDKPGKLLLVKAPSSPTPGTSNNGIIFNTTPSCTVSRTVVRGQTYVCKESLIFSDEFIQANVSELRTQWVQLIQFLDEPDYPFNMYMPLINGTISLEDGSLVITPIFADSKWIYRPLDFSNFCTGKVGTLECRRESSGTQIVPHVVTAKLTTRRTFSFKYGRVEVRAKLPSGKWILPEINLEPTDNVYGENNYASGLIRIAFLLNAGDPDLNKFVYGGPILTDAEPFRTHTISGFKGNNSWNEDFHNYSIIWAPEGLAFYVDDEQYYKLSPTNNFADLALKNNVTHASHWKKGTKIAPLDQMFHVTLGLRVGGINDFSDDIEGKPWRNTASKAMLQFWRAKDTWYPTWTDGAMKIDYVRVYAL